MHLFTIWQLWSKGHCKIQQRSFLGHPIGYAVFVCADSFRYGVYIFIEEEDDNEEEYTEGESGDDPRGAKKIEKK